MVLVLWRLSKMFDEEAWVIGEEHYLDIFTPFATHCFSPIISMKKCILLLFYQRKNSRPYFFLMLRCFIIPGRQKLKVIEVHLELYMKNEIYDQLVAK